MKLPLDPLCCALALGTVLTTAGTRETPVETRPEVPLAVEELLADVVRRGAHRFQPSDVPLVVNAMMRSNIDKFLVTIDPSTGRIDLEVGEQLTPHLDIKPGSCPNPVNVQDDAATGLASRVNSGVLGNAFDVTQIDLGSTRMSRAGIFLGDEGDEISPVHLVFADVGTPFVGRECACHALTGDGILDLVAQFDKHSMIVDLKLEDVPHNVQTPMRVFGMLTEGRGIFSAVDCVRVLQHGTEE